MSIGTVRFAIVATTLTPDARTRGGGMRIADARIDDGLLNLVIVREIPKSLLLSIFPNVL